MGRSERKLRLGGFWDREVKSQSAWVRAELRSDCWHSDGRRRRDRHKGHEDHQGKILADS